MWRVHRAANRPWPILSDDPIVDYMVMEAVFLRVQQEEADAEKERARKDWKAAERKKLVEQYGQ